MTFWFFGAILETVNSTFDLKEKNTSENLEACVINSIFFFEKLMLGLYQAKNLPVGSKHYMYYGNPGFT